MFQISSSGPIKFVYIFSIINIFVSQIVSLNSLSGNKVVLWFYPKASTPGWTIEGQGFRDELNLFKDQGFQVFGVSADSVKKQKNFHTKQKFNFDLLSDESHDMLKNYGVWSLKKFMGREYMGFLRVTYIINQNGMIEQVYDTVKTKTHAQDILHDL